MTGQAILQVSNLKKFFPLGRGVMEILIGAPKRSLRAVDGVSFELQLGEILALVGESGSGKTTVGMNVLGLQQPTAGKITLNGYDVAEWAVGAGPSLELENEEGPGGTVIKLAYLGRRRRVMILRERAQMIFQDPYEALNPRQKVFEIVSEPLVIHRLVASKEAKIDRVRQALEASGLSPAENFWDRFPEQLSGGERQRVVIASALVLEPELLVADEPVSMLDVSIRAEILNLLKSLRDERDITILYITHDLATAGFFSDRIAVMYLGRIVEIGPTRTVLANPRHPYTQALISVMPAPNPRGRRKRTVLKGEIPDPVDIPPGCRFHPRCPVAIPECRQVDPEFRTAGTGHEAACILV